MKLVKCVAKGEFGFYGQNNKIFLVVIIIPMANVMKIMSFVINAG